MFWKLGQIAYAPEGVGDVTPPAPPAPPPSEHPVSAPWTGAEGVWKIGEGDTAQPWWSTLPDETARRHVEAKQYANPAELALANYNLTRLQTGDPQVLALPGKDAAPEAWDAVYNRLGRPESPDKYEFQFGEGVKADDKMVEFGKKLFHAAGVSQDRAQAAANMWNEFVAEQTAATLEATKQQNDAELNALTSRWGADLDKNKAAGQRVVQALGLSADLIQRVEDSIGSAAIVELLATIGRKSDEGGLISGGQADPNNPDTMSKEQAQAKIAALQGDAEFQKKYTDKNHPEHKQAVELMVKLFARG